MGDTPYRSNERAPEAPRPRPPAKEDRVAQWLQVLGFVFDVLLGLIR